MSGGRVGDSAWIVEARARAFAIELGGDGGDGSVAEIDIVRVAQIPGKGGDRTVRGDGTNAMVSTVRHEENTAGADGNVCWEMKPR